MSDLASSGGTDRAYLAFVRSEFLAPIAGLIGMIDILAEDAETASLGHYAADVGRMRNSAAGLHDRVSALLGASKPDESSAPGSSLRHDLRTPVTAIIGYGELVAEEARERGDVGLFAPLADVLDAAGRLLGELDKLVALARSAGPGGEAESVGRSAVPDVLRHAAEVARGLLRREAPPPSSAQRGRILLVDDNASMRDLVSRKLKRDGHQVRVAGSGHAALRLAETDEFDLMLLDLMMPGMNGLDVLDRLREQPRTQGLPVIVISALDEAETAIRCIEAGADDYLSKPLNETFLRARISSSLERKFLRDRERDTLSRLQEEQRRSEALLGNVLPADVVERLRQGETVVADHFDSVTVLFCDLVGFTALTSALEPSAVLDLLNETFSEFDRLAETHGLEKIKTVGDAYMAVCGRIAHADDHVERVVRMAIEMPRVAASIDVGARSPFQRPLQVRIGIDTGPAIGGIIGRRKFFYDIWGDAVNFASRLESTSEPGRIHASAAVRSRIRDNFLFERRPIINVKGKGSVQTYFIGSDLQNK